MNLFAYRHVVLVFENYRVGNYRSVRRWIHILNHHSAVIKVDPLLSTICTTHYWSSSCLLLCSIFFGNDEQFRTVFQFRKTMHRSLFR